MIETVPHMWMINTFDIYSKPIHLISGCQFLIRSCAHNPVDLCLFLKHQSLCSAAHDYITHYFSEKKTNLWISQNDSILWISFVMIFCRNFIWHITRGCYKYHWRYTYHRLRTTAIDYYLIRITFKNQINTCAHLSHIVASAAINKKTNELILTNLQTTWNA